MPSHALSELVFNASRANLLISAVRDCTSFVTDGSIFALLRLKFLNISALFNFCTENEENIF